MLNGKRFQTGPYKGSWDPSRDWVWMLGRTCQVPLVWWGRLGMRPAWTDAQETAHEQRLTSPGRHRSSHHAPPPPCPPFSTVFQKRLWNIRARARGSTRRPQRTGRTGVPARQALPVTSCVMSGKPQLLIANCPRVAFLGHRLDHLTTVRERETRF